MQLLSGQAGTQAQGFWVGLVAWTPLTQNVWRGQGLPPADLCPPTPLTQGQGLSWTKLCPPTPLTQGQGLSPAELCLPTPLTQGQGLSWAELSAPLGPSSPGLAPEMLMVQEPLLPKRGLVDAADAAMGSPAKGPHL